MFVIKTQAANFFLLERFKMPLISSNLILQYIYIESLTGQPISTGRRMSCFQFKVKKSDLSTSAAPCWWTG